MPSIGSLIQDHFSQQTQNTKRVTPGKLDTEKVIAHAKNVASKVKGLVGKVADALENQNHIQEEVYAPSDPEFVLTEHDMRYAFKKARESDRWKKRSKEVKMIQRDLSHLLGRGPYSPIEVKTAFDVLIGNSEQPNLQGKPRTDSPYIKALEEEVLVRLRDLDVRKTLQRLNDSNKNKELLEAKKRLQETQSKKSQRKVA